MRYIRYKCQKQQINYLNCNKIDQWIDTCQTRITDFVDVCESNCKCKTYEYVDKNNKSNLKDG